MTPAEILRAAADLIEPAGAWTQGVLGVLDTGELHDNGYTHGVCSRCLLGAIEGIVRDEFDSPAAMPAYVALQEYLVNEIGHHNIVQWNDAEDRTQPEVVAALRSAADKWEAENGGGK